MIPLLANHSEVQQNWDITIIGKTRFVLVIIKIV